MRRRQRKNWQQRAELKRRAWLSNWPDPSELRQSGEQAKADRRRSKTDDRRDRDHDA